MEQRGLKKKNQSNILHDAPRTFCTASLDATSGNPGKKNKIKLVHHCNDILHEKV